MRQAQRIAALPPYLFAEIDRKVAVKKAEGVDVISLGIGDPVEPTPQHIIDKMLEQVKNPENHRYPSYYGMPAFRKTAAKWFEGRFGVPLDPDEEILPLIGSKEGLAHLYLALTDPGDKAIIPDPGYPVYHTGAILANAETINLPLLEKNNFLPDYSLISTEDAKAAKLLLLNYPNNPTSAIAGKNTWAEAVEFCKQYDIALISDSAYCDLTYDGYVAPSVLETPGAKDIAIELISLSKTYNMTGWRIAFAAGNKEILEALGRVKTNIDSGIFNAIQYAGMEALEGPQDCVQEMIDIYSGRRDRMLARLEGLGWDVKACKGSVFLWMKVPDGYTSASFAEFVLEEAGVIVSPGSAYGPSGEGFIRMTMTLQDDRIDEAIDCIVEALG